MVMFPPLPGIAGRKHLNELLRSTRSAVMHYMNFLLFFVGALKTMNSGTRHVYAGRL